MNAEKCPSFGVCAQHRESPLVEVGGGLKEIFVSLRPKATGPDCLSQHASHLCMNTRLVWWSGQKAPLSPGHPTQGFNTSDSPHAHHFSTVWRATLGRGEKCRTRVCDTFWKSRPARDGLGGTLFNGFEESSFWKPRGWVGGYKDGDFWADL